MRILIVKLPDSPPQNVAVSTVMPRDHTDLVESVDDAVALLHQRAFDAAVLVGGGCRAAANQMLEQMREAAPKLSVVLLGNPRTCPRACPGRPRRCWIPSNWMSRAAS